MADLQQCLVYCCVHVFWGLAHPLSRAAGPAQGLSMLVCISWLLLVLTALVNCKVFMIYLTGVRCHEQHVLIRATVTWCRYRKPNPFAVPPMRQGSRSCCFFASQWIFARWLLLQWAESESWCLTALRSFRLFMRASGSFACFHA